MTDKQREAFERWFGQQRWPVSIMNEMQDACWRAWQAALSQQPVGEKELKSFLYDESCDASDYAPNVQVVTPERAARKLLARFNISDRGK